MATPEEDVAGALESLADALGAPADIDQNTVVQTPPRQAGKLNPGSLSAVVATLPPENAIVMDESNTSMGRFLVMSQSAARHTLLTQPGGAIGLGPPGATGAAIACPDRPVINLQADDSAMYTLQALSMAVNNCIGGTIFKIVPQSEANRDDQSIHAIVIRSKSAKEYSIHSASLDGDELGIVGVAPTINLRYKRHGSLKLKFGGSGRKSAG